MTFPFPVMFSPLNRSIPLTLTYHNPPAIYYLVNWIYYLDKCIFRPAMFSPRQRLWGVVYTDGKMLPPLDSARLGIEGQQIVPENPPSKVNEFKRLFMPTST